MDPIYFYKVPGLFMSNLKNDPVLQPVFNRIDDDKFHKMVTHIFNYVFKESVTLQDIEYLVETHAKISITSEMCTAWIAALESTLREMDMEDAHVRKIVQKALYITSKLVNVANIPLHMIDNIMKSIETCNENMDKDYILRRLGSLRDLLMYSYCESCKS